jgi:hypothetical protein
MPFRLVGTDANQVPTNADLGSMAFQDARGVSIGQANIQYLYVNGGDATNIQVLDDISSLFDGVITTFALTIDNFPIIPVAPEQLLLVVGGTPLAPAINTIDNVFLTPTFATGFIANSSSSVPGSVGMSFNFTKGYLVNANGTVTFASPPQPYMDFDGRMLNNSQTYSASRSYPFNPIAIAYTDY